MTSFRNILGAVSKRIDMLSRTENYRSVISGSDELKTELYQYFNLSGASLVIADNLTKKVVLLQEEVEEALFYPQIDFPVNTTPKDQSKSILSGINPKVNLNKLSNRIFQIFRNQQGLGESADVITFNHVPEFFSELSSGFDDNSSTEFIHYDKGKLLYGYLAWRFLIWVMSVEGNDIELNNENIIGFFAKRKTKILGGVRYFDKRFFEFFKEINIDYPEFGFRNLDLQESWHTNAGSFGEEYHAWIKVREKVDSLKESFEEELQIINNFVDHGVIKKLYRFLDISPPDKNQIDFEVTIDVIKNLINQNPQETILSKLLQRLHYNCPLIIPYYYFVLIDGIMKEHLVFPIWRSLKYPVSFFNNNELKKHSVVLCSVISIDTEINEPRVLELQIIFKLLSEKIIDELFVSRLIRAKLREDRYQFERIILSSNPISLDTRGVYLLGSLEKRITFAAQQYRALNLIRSLKELQVIHENTSIGIIGGGLSGVTSAMACSIIGLENITLYEAEDEILNIQSRSNHRYIHPNIFDWPETIYHDMYPKVPFLRWKADYANNVTDWIRQKFYQYNKGKNDSGGLISIRKNIRVHDIPGKLNNGQFALLDNEGNRLSTHDIVILAVGFGQEVLGIKNKSSEEKLFEIVPSYWEPDELTETFEEPKKILIIGSGDGGLIDLVRARLTKKDEQHTGSIDHLSLFELTKKNELRLLAEKLKKFDKEFWAKTHIGVYEKELFNYYDENLRGEDLFPSIDILKRYLRNDTTVTFGYRSVKLRLETSLLNRLLVFLLIKGDLIKTHKCGNIIGREGANFEFENKMIDVPDIIICRTGPKNTYLEDCFGSLKASISDHKRLISRLNITNYISDDTMAWYQEYGIKKGWIDDEWE